MRYDGRREEIRPDGLIGGGMVRSGTSDAVVVFVVAVVELVMMGWTVLLAFRM